LADDAAAEQPLGVDLVRHLIEQDAAAQRRVQFLGPARAVEIIGVVEAVDQPELAQLFDHVLGELGSLVPLHDVGRDLTFRKFTDGAFQLQLFVAELEVQRFPLMKDRVKENRRLYRPGLPQER